MTTFTHNAPPTPALPLTVLGDQPTLGSAAAPDPYRERRFKYDGKEFDDPGAEYSSREVLGYLAATYPELANGSWTTTTHPDYDVITFHKVTGEKGLDLALRNRARALANIDLMLDLAEEPEESDWAWRSALSWEWHAEKWQDVINTWRDYILDKATLEALAL
jgi:PRTRC genetic system protein C